MKTILFLIGLMAPAACFSQQITVGLSYNYLYSKQYDQLIQMYNFSRPHLSEEQPLLDSGFGIDGSYLFNSEKNLKTGVRFDYSMFSSTAENTDHEVAIALNMLELGYLLNYSNKETFGNFYGEVSLNAVIGLMNKRVDGEPYTEDDSRINSFQVGTSLNARLGYSIPLNESLQLSPFVGVNYAPYFTEGQSEVVINQTDGLLAEQYNAFFKFNAGVRIHFIR